ncbi:hypothetical protein P153DRAFT_400586 [Dothidotthia symphoricarpi CBS 119687]|uniref:BZIP domain-containing protein n=1 Tax=Dothidotthia symphoricarpi CBS 119687 TaxID=1392245 RepID=A0A6A6A1P1_9PLEO|nr:uncharacterized protein P153DRAFT_400586 [Dothidotthia symphoricarpi CBS 119687]KAF2125093.1 hypothetical protein P153DRAFT_400586 [Dothidotthia symphoricarpi CBS 119687]
MSKNSKDDLTRIRDNQRRSRTRRKELVQDLQARVHAFEARGVAATQEMQRAARKVAVENGRLRELLARRGVGRGEVEGYLRGCEGVGEGGEGGKGRVLGDEGRAEEMASPGDGHVYLHQHPQPQQPDDTLDPQLSQYVQETQSSNTAETSGPPYTDAQPTTSIPPLTPTDTVDDLGCPNTADCFCPPSLPPTNQPLSSAALEISCETAATIIAQMRGDGDRESARAALGCGRGEVCSVKNSVIMQIMDEG